MQPQDERLKEICDEQAHQDGALLPILHQVQQEFGCISEDAQRVIAACLNLTRAEVHGVVSFYHDFRSQPDDRPEVQVCRAEACKARGVEALIASAREAAGSRVRLSTVYCLGLCSVGPNVRIGDEMHSRLNANRITELIERA